MMKKTIRLSKILALAFMATSIALFNFENPVWIGNEKSYIGVIAGLIIWFWDKKS